MSRLLASVYDLLLLPTERLCLRAWRRELLSDLQGDIVEIGAGTGLSLDCYPTTITSLTLCEPDPHMLVRLRRQLHRAPYRPNLLIARGEALPLASACCDAVVIFLTLCSVEQPGAVLAEAYRLLRPGGRLIFLEHVAGTPHSAVARWQKRIEPVWRRIAGNCHLTRPTGQLISAAGFTVERLDPQPICLAPFFVRPAIRGSARKGA